MQSFVVFEGDGIDARQYPPRHAYLHGPDELPLQADIAIDPTVILAKHQAPHSIALVAQLPLGGQGGDMPPLGILTLPTCLLPDRAQPYLLAIELARHRVMLLVNKLEDWGLTDLPPDHPIMQRFEEARQALTEALVAQRAGKDEADSATARAGYAADAARLAVRALAIGVDAGERLALLQADRQAKQRSTGQAYREAVQHYVKLTQESPTPNTPVVIPGAGGGVLPGTAMVGCSISPGSFTEPLQRAASSVCDFVSMPMRWVDMEPVEGKYAFAQTDRWIEWAVRQAKVPVFAGPLVDFRASCVPDYLYIWENDYETLRDLVVEHVQAIVTRYRRTVARWTVVSGLNVNTNFKISFEQVMDLTRIGVLLVRKLHPGAKVVVEIAQPWGEYHATNRRSLPPLVYAEAIVQSGIPIDALGLRIQMGHAQPGLSTRDLMSISALLDRYAQFDKPLAVTLGCPAAPIPPAPYQPRVGSAAEDPYEPGYWRSPWSEAQQAEWLAQVGLVCASKPFVQSVCWHELADPAAGPAPEMPMGGLLNASLQPRPALARLAQLRAALREARI